MILLDTGVLVALCDPADSLNKTALRQLKVLARAQFAVCEPVLTEAAFHLPTLSQRRRLQRFMEELDVSHLSVNDADPGCTEVFAWLEKYADHDPDWADACIAVLCGRDRKHKLWTYDAEFRTIWRRPDGSLIPTAIR